MRIIYSPRFRRSYRKLPQEIQAEAERRVKIFREDPRDHRLKTHKLKGELRGLWSFSVTHSYRIVIEFEKENTVIFHTIGDHSVYD